MPNEKSRFIMKWFLYCKTLFKKARVLKGKKHYFDNLMALCKEIESHWDIECENPNRAGYSKQINPICPYKRTIISKCVALLSQPAASLSLWPELWGISSCRWCFTDTQWWEGKVQNRSCSRGRPKKQQRTELTLGSLSVKLAAVTLYFCTSVWALVLTQSYSLHI